MLHRKTECLITGDFNLNLLKHNVHSDTGCFLNGLLHDSFIPLITRPTRFTDSSSTLIDNIFSNKIFDKAVSGTLITDISDHLPVFYIKNEICQNSNVKFVRKTYYKRNITEQGINNLKMKLSETDWSDIASCSDTNMAYNLFLTRFTAYYNECLPLQCKTTKNKKQLNKPWITLGILKSIRKKNKLYKKYLNNRSVEMLDKYKSYKNKLTTIIRKAEKMHYANKFEQAKGNLSQTWQIIKGLINSEQVSKQIGEIRIDDVTVTDKNKIANKFNDYFVNIGPQLANKIPAATGDPIKYIQGDFPNSMVLYNTDPTEIAQIVHQLKNSSSKGHDGILPTVIKSTIDEIAMPLSIIFNLSFEKCIFPDKLKIARIVPIYKSDDKMVVNNYRPISVLPFFSKIIERLMYNRLLCYLDKNDILIKNQYGFREKHSTYMALIKLLDQITNELDNKQFSIGIFIDLSKAFDTIDHNILIRKLQCYGIRGSVLDWFKSYLNNRQQYTCINDANSDVKQVTCGVPQGSILGPLLFIIYINDIVHASDIANLIMFADDTNLFYSNNSLDTLCNDINDDLVKISLWFRLNRLSLNVKKTNFMIFSTRNKKLPLSKMCIKIDDIAIEQVNHTKFLGLIMTDRLTWDMHVKTVYNKASKNIGIIYRIRHLIPLPTLKNLYFTLVNPYYEYCNIVWGSGKSIAFRRLERSQKRAVRAVVFANRRTHTAPIFKQLNVLTIVKINKLQTASFVFKAINKLLPSQFANFFTPNYLVHNHYTRQKFKLHSVPHRINCRTNSIRILGSKLWNSLNNELRTSSTVKSFQRQYKQLLINSDN